MSSVSPFIFSQLGFVTQQVAQSVAAGEVEQALAQVRALIGNEALVGHLADAETQLRQVLDLLRTEDTRAEGLALLASLAIPPEGETTPPFQEAPSPDERLSHLEGAKPAEAPPLWRTPETPLSLVDAWREAIGTAVLKALRWRHTRFSPSLTAQAGGLWLAVWFDPSTGTVLKVRSIPTPSANETPSPEADMVRLFYDFEGQRIYLEGHLAATRVVAPLEEEPKLGERRRHLVENDPPSLEATFLPTAIVPILRSIHGRLVEFPPQRLRTRVVDGTVVVELGPGITRSNRRYLQEVMDSISGGTMTIIGSAADPKEFEPEIYVSVAPNGLFIGVLYQMPPEHSPRGTTYEVGTPSLGMLARIEYAFFRNPVTREIEKIPLAGHWESRRPSRIQAAALDRWLRDPRIEEARSHWERVTGLF